MFLVKKIVELIWNISDFLLTILGCKITMSWLNLGRILLLLTILKRVGYLAIIGIELPQRYRVCLGTETNVLAKE